MPIPKIPIPDPKTYPNRVGDPNLNRITGDCALEGTYNSTVLLTHDEITGAPIITITAKRISERPNYNEDGSTIVVTGGSNIDSLINYSTKNYSNNIPNAQNTKAIALNTDDIRMNSRKDCFVSSGKKLILVSVDNIVIEGSKNLQIKVKGNCNIEIDNNITIKAPQITLESTNVKLGKVASKRVVTELFAQAYNAHIHSTPAGPSGVPSVLLTDLYLSSDVKVK